MPTSFLTREAYDLPGAMARKRPSRIACAELWTRFRACTEISPSGWPLLSAPEDYADEAAEYRRLIVEGADGEVRDVLELGSGGGNNASHMKASFDLTLVDRSPGMLEVSRRLNPECEHVEGDMRSVRLDRTFDAVFVHDSIAYITTEEDLRAVFETAFVHCRPGGVALFVPDSVRETFGETTDHGGHDGDDRALRYLEWTWDPDPSDTTVRMDLTYVFHEPDGSVHAELDMHLCGLFPTELWLGGLRDVGFEPRSVELTGDESRIGSLGFMGRRPPSRGRARLGRQRSSTKSVW